MRLTSLLVFAAATLAATNASAMSPEKQIQATEAKPINIYSEEERGRSGGGGRGGFGRSGFGRSRSGGGYWGSGRVRSTPLRVGMIPNSFRSGEEEEEKVHSHRKGIMKLFDWF